MVVLAILRLHVVLLKKPSPITEDFDDDRWKYFKDRSKYRTRKGTIAMNVSGVCSPEMEFIYVLPGWEGSAHDGCYYLCDARYANGEGFLTPFRGHLYHLREWNNGPRQPQSAEECFNLIHAGARNVIERYFGVLKGRWGILISPSWFSLQTHGHIVMACCLLHNLIKKYMHPGSIFEDISDDEDSDCDCGGDGDDGEVDYITSIDTSDPWTNYRNSLAQTMFNNWRARVRRD